MTKDNAAARLHWIFEEYLANADTKLSIWNTWKATFSSDSDAETTILLGKATALMHDIEQSVEQAAHPSMVRLVERHMDRWGRVLWPKDYHMISTPSPGTDLIDEDSLVALGSLAAFLEGRDNEEAMPSEDEIDELRVSLTKLFESLRTTQTLPKDLRLLINQRLHDIAWALDNVWLGGPDAVQSAIERLVAQIMLRTDESERAQSSGFLRSIIAFAGTAYKTFLGGEKAVKAFEAYAKVVGEIGPGA